MEQDFGRLKRLHGDLGALRAICKSEFVIRSIDDVMADIAARLRALEAIEHVGAVQHRRAEEAAPSLR